MADRGFSREGLFGDIHHYDQNGRKIGTSSPDMFGGYTNYDTSGRKTGHSEPCIFGGYDHFDRSGHKIGHSNPGMFGGYNHFDMNNRPNGSSDPGMFGGYNHSSSQGCYIATCVYGSYDCPEVWALRRFRDTTLASTRCGRAFIRTYYAVSPALVKRFGHTKWFKKMWKSRLDKLVSRLKKNGVEDTPYNDRRW